jgi:hypothetical protein
MNNLKRVLLACCFFVAAVSVSAEDAKDKAASDKEPAAAQTPDTIPPALIQPERGATPVYAVDTVIGDLGAGDAPEPAYTTALQAVNALFYQRKKAESLASLNAAKLKALINKIADLKPKRFRVGSAKVEPDGSVSFLFHLIGGTDDAVGEVYVVQREKTWTVDDLLIEQKSDWDKDNQKTDNGDYSYPAYARFY